MKKITLLILISFFGFSAYAQFPAPYCGPLTFTTNVEPITLVNFAGINNVTSATVGPNNGTTIFAHENFTSITGNVVAGSTYPITLKGNTDGNFNTNLSVFVDWNGDNDFADAGETYNVGSILNSTGVDAVQLVGTIVVPSTATAGNKRMRVVKKYDNLTTIFPTACQAGAGYGQAEDYSLTVTVPTCLAPSAGLATVTSSTTANLSWTSGGAANAEIVIQTAGTGIPNTANNTGVNVTGSTYAASALTAATAYEFYVRDECADGSIFSTWSGPFSFNTTQLPGCVSNPTPIDGAINVPVGTITLTWNVPTTGDAPTSYDLYSGNTATTVTNLVGNYTTNTTGTALVINAYNVVIYWKVVAKNIAGEATNCFVWGFITQSSPGFCLTAPNGQWPTAANTPTTCDGLTDNVITANGYAGEYSVVNVTLGQTYVFKSGTTDFITISADAGVTAATFGATPLTWVSTIAGPIRFYSHVNDQCGAESVNRIRSVVCGVAATDSPDYVNLQFPATATIAQGGTATVYGQIYEANLTDVTSGQAPGVLAWVGISPLGVNSNPNTWTTWVPATFNVESNNNDEYQANIGATLAPGTYYYATRFNLNNGAYVYGGINATNDGNFWDAATFGSGVLTVTPPPAPANDECQNVISLTPGGTYAQYLTNATNLGATTSSQAVPTVCFGYSGGDVWYSVVVPQSGSITLETGDSTTGQTGVDTVVTVYSGDCTTLTQIGCDDDGAATGGYSLLTLTGQTAGSTILIRVYEYNNDNAGGFAISAWDGSLSTTAFDNSNFTYYPNPVKNILNLSYTKDISNVAVFNLLGQEVIAKSLNANQGQIDMSNLANGAYFVKITADNQVKTIKVIKE
jgi:hypothetical protein